MGAGLERRNRNGKQMTPKQRDYWGARTLTFGSMRCFLVIGHSFGIELIFFTSLDWTVKSALAESRMTAAADNFPAQIFGCLFSKAVQPRGTP